MCVSDGWYNPPAGVAAKTQPSGKYPEFMLFDIKQDPEEENDISGQAEFEDKLEKMKEKLAGYMDMVVATVTANQVPAADPGNHNGTWVSGWC